MTKPSTIRCSGEFFNQEHCDTNVSLSTRVCAYCDRFQVDRCRIVLCRSADTPFAARKRLIRIDNASITLDLRFFALDDDTVYDGLLVFKNRDQADVAISTWPDRLTLLPSLMGDSVDFIKCHWCRRKVHPTMLSTCTKPSCVKKANSKKRPPSDPNAAPSDLNDAEKRRRQWRICPDQMEVWSSDRNDFILPRAVIQAPEQLSASSVSVKFGEHNLRRDLDFICGLQEVVILSIPWPTDTDSREEDDRITNDIVVSDGTGVSGSLQFTYIMKRSSSNGPAAAAAPGSDLDEQIQRLHLFEDEDPECHILSPLFPSDDQQQQSLTSIAFDLSTSVASPETYSS